jgi:hypothetical protein
VREDLACNPTEWKCLLLVEALEMGCRGEMLEKRHARRQTMEQHHMKQDRYKSCPVST